MNEELQNHIRRKIDEESEIPVWEDTHLEDLIKLRLKEIREEAGKEEEPEDELELRQIKVDLKYQLVFEIPLPTNDPKLVEEAIKLFIEHIESKTSKTKVSGHHTLVGKPNDS